MGRTFKVESGTCSVVESVVKLKFGIHQITTSLQNQALNILLVFLSIGLHVFFSGTVFPVLLLVLILLRLHIDLHKTQNLTVGTIKIYSGGFSDLGSIKSPHAFKIKP